MRAASGVLKSWIRGAGVVLSVALAVLASAGRATAQPPPPPVPPLPAPAVPPQNPITEAKRLLGKVLFWDEQLSTDNTMSCGTCHSMTAGGSDRRRARTAGPDGILNNADDVFGSPGVIASDALNDYVRHAVFGTAPQVTGRNSMGVIDAAFATDLFWDGRARTTFTDPQTGQVVIPTGGGLESQVVGPPLSDVEMAHASRNWNQVAEKLRTARPLAIATGLPADVAAGLADQPDYPTLFARAFGDSAITAARIAMAIATYERTLIANDTPWDRFNAGQTTALTPQQQQGLQAFQASNCAVCHTPPMFSNQSFRNIGLRPPGEDLGRQIVTGNAADRGRFKVPSLRNVGLRQSFMHNGVFTTIPAVIGFYARAPGAPPQFQDNIDPVMATVNVPPQAAQVIDVFIRTGLTDTRVANGTFPFDSPTLYSERPGDRPTSLGGGVSGSGGIVPGVIANAPWFIGNADFKLGLRNARGGVTATLAISTLPPVNGRITAQRTAGPFAVSAGGNGQGVATFHWPVLPINTRPGDELYVQWVVADPAAPGGQARSDVVRLRAFCGSVGCPTPCAADLATDGSGDPASGGDGVVSGTDFDVFIVAFFTDARRADQTLIADVANDAGDIGADGFVTGGDFDAFIQAFFKGC